MRKLSVALVVFGLFAAACSGGDRVVATVNGLDIDEKDVTSLIDTGDEVVFDSADFRQLLTTLIFQEIVADGLFSEFGISVDLAEAERQVEADLATAGITVEQALANLGIPGATERMLVRDGYTRLLVEEATTALAARPDFVENLLAENGEALTEVCVRHILVETADEAQDVLARLLGGEDFAAVADAVSLDTATPAGDLGCSAASRYVPEFAEASVTAPVGEVFGPVQTDFGFHVLIVDDRTAPTAAELAADPTALIPADVLQAEFVSWFNEQVQAADVSVSSRVGTWSAEGPGIIPPE